MKRNDSSLGLWNLDFSGPNQTRVFYVLVKKIEVPWNFVCASLGKERPNHRRARHDMQCARCLQTSILRSPQNSGLAKLQRPSKFFKIKFYSKTTFLKKTFTLINIFLRAYVHVKIFLNSC